MVASKKHFQMLEREAINKIDDHTSLYDNPADRFTFKSEAAMKVPPIMKDIIKVRSLVSNPI